MGHDHEDMPVRTAVSGSLRRSSQRRRTRRTACTRTAGPATTPGPVRATDVCTAACEAARCEDATTSRSGTWRRWCRPGRSVRDLPGAAGGARGPRPSGRLGPGRPVLHLQRPAWNVDDDEDRVRLAVRYLRRHRHQSSPALAAEGSGLRTLRAAPPACRLRSPPQRAARGRQQRPSAVLRDVRPGTRGQPRRREPAWSHGGPGGRADGRTARSVRGLSGWSARTRGPRPRDWQDPWHLVLHLQHRDGQLRG